MDEVTAPGETPRFVVCVKNDGYTMDLARDRAYEVMPDPSAERSGWIRVVAQTEEDYLYPSAYFASMTDPESVLRRREGGAAPSTGG
ncbi:MAG TPA: hypothetical protein VFT45_12115 [Longimicrobium sp.]|nr:hypothetical protein [Longimicrobium sp.]